MATKRRKPKPTYEELTARIEELETENEDLNERLDSISQLAATEDEDDDVSGDESDTDE